VTLAAQTTYYVLSEERAGGDRFGDLNTLVQTTAVGVQNSGVYAQTTPNFYVVGGPTQSYGPPNFRYAAAGAVVLPTVTLQEPAMNANYAPPANITLRATFSVGVTNVDFYHGETWLGRDTHNPATFVWLNAPLGNYVLTARAKDTNGNVASSTAVNVSVRTPGLGHAFVVSKVLGEVRNDFSGLVGMKVTTGNQSLTVTELGRIKGPGNANMHAVKFVKALDLSDLPNGGVSINMAGGTVGEFNYATLGTPVVLQANTPYYLVTLETAGGDRWYDVAGTVITTQNAAVVNSGVYMGSGYGWSLAGLPQHTYGPVDFKYQVNPSVPAAPSGGGADHTSPRLLVENRDGAASLSVRGTTGQHFIVEASNDLEQWTTIAEHDLERALVRIVDLEPKRGFRFYRLGR
jgi:hypothetical protein